MIFRSRSAGFAGLALALAVPLVAAYAAPAFAAGDDAVVSAAITAGNVHVESTKGLSRVTVVLCDGTTVVADERVNMGEIQTTANKGGGTQQILATLEVTGIDQLLRLMGRLESRLILSRLAGE